MINCREKRKEQGAELPFFMQDDRPGWRAGRIPENVSDPVTISEDPETNKNILLSRGQYRARGRFQVSGRPDPEKMLQSNIELPIQYQGEYKRVVLHKIDIQPARHDPALGENFSDYTIVFTVVDNPLPLVPIVWGVAGVATLTSGYFFVDKVESFTETGTGSLLMLGLTAAALFLAIGDRNGS